MQRPSSSTQVETEEKKNKKMQDFDIHFLLSLCLSPFLNQGFDKQFKHNKCELSCLRCPLSLGI